MMMILFLFIPDMINLKLRFKRTVPKSKANYRLHPTHLRSSFAISYILPPRVGNTI